MKKFLHEIAETTIGYLIFMVCSIPSGIIYGIYCLYYRESVPILLLFLFPGLVLGHYVLDKTKYRKHFYLWENKDGR